ncbi:DNA-binding protein RFX8 [Ctenodactylus gundi]
MATGSEGPRSLQGRILQWLVDNFCVCEGRSLPRYLLYEIYMETCGQNSQNQVNPAMFGKLVRLAFPDLGTRRLGTRGSARYHYVGIYIKKSSFLYAQYCCLLGEKSCHSCSIHGMSWEVLLVKDLQTASDSSDTVQEPKPLHGRIQVGELACLDLGLLTLLGLPFQSSEYSTGTEMARGCPPTMQVASALRGGDVSVEKSTDCNKILQQERTCENDSPVKTALASSPSPQFTRCSFWEQELAKKYSYEMVAFLADEYSNYCQVILQSARNQELERVENFLTSFWKSLQQDTVLFMALPDVHQLLKCYDVQLYKGLEDILLRDFLDDVSIQYLKSVRLFSKKFKLWLLHALEGFPDLLQISRLKEVSVFTQRLKRKTYLSNMAKAGATPGQQERDSVLKSMRTVLRNPHRVGLLKEDLHTVVHQGALALSQTAVPKDPCHAEDQESPPETKCLSCLISLLGTSTDLSVFLNYLSSSLQASVFQPSRSKEEFTRLAAGFQLRWNFLLTAVSKAMTLCHRPSFGSWHLFHLLLMEYVNHIFQSCVEEEEKEEDSGNPKNVLPNDQPLLQPVQTLFHPLASSQAQEYMNLSVEPPQVMLGHVGQRCLPVDISNLVLWVLGFQVDTATGNKLIQVLLEDKATDNTIKLDLPVGEEALITLRDGQKFVIHVADIPQSSEDIFFPESSADAKDGDLQRA